MKHTIIKTLNYFSIVWIFPLVGSLFYVLIKTRKFPRFSNPDPSQIIPNFNVITEVFHLSNILLGVLLLLNAWILIDEGSFKAIKKSVVFFGMTLVLKLILYTTDPFGILEWFFD